MTLECSLLQKKSLLTDTKNRLLKETESTCQRKYLLGTANQKLPLGTKFSLQNKHLTVNKYLRKQNVENKFLKIDISSDYSRSRELDYDELRDYEEKPSDAYLPYVEGITAGFLKKKKKKIRSAYEELEMEDVSMVEEDTFLSAPPPQHEQYRSPMPARMALPMLKRMAAPADFYCPVSPTSCALGYSQQSIHRSNLFGSAPGFSFVGTEPPIPYLDEMPAYNFLPLALKQPSEPDYKSLEEDSELLFKNRLKEVKRMKMRLLNAVSTSLLYSPHFKKEDDPFRVYLLKCARDVIPFDPEFILKVALYARQELNIRSTANFLLAFAAYENSCSPFLKKYFEASICLPTDWINVAEMYLVFGNPNLKPRSLPAALRKAMKSSFAKFDNYQLAKYNKKGGKSGKTKKVQVEGSSDVEMNEAVSKFYTLKQLIRLLHITSPVEPVMCILGKKYPSDPESFRQHGLPGVWNSAKAGKRMKLPIAETWETAVSAKGNKAEVWESLIDNGKLPYMATLRNLRNLILANISNGHHERVLSRLSKKEAVMKSRQLPLRFYAAFKVLDDISNLYYENFVTTAETRGLPVWKIMQQKALMKKIEGIDINIIEKYKESLSKALEISANHNLDPISGKTLVVVDLTDNLSETSGSAAEYFNKKFHSCILLSLMCLKACEECDVKAILSNMSVEPVKLTSKSFLENMSELLEKYENSGMCVDSDEEDEENFYKALFDLPEYYLKVQTLLSQKLNNVIFLKSNSDPDDRVGKIISNFLHKYRQLVNPNLLYIQVDLSVDVGRLENLPQSSDENNIFLAGFSEHIFKFIAERSNGGQLSHIENIDKKYDLTEKLKIVYSEDSPKNNLNIFSQKIPLYSGIPKWKTARIFISSTFKDMHGERDLLLRYVFPELKARAASVFVKINEIDLRWGISEADSISARSHQLCLLEAQSCDFFIGILGDRYGTQCTFAGEVDPRLNWVKSYPKSSITELEMHCGALNREGSREKAFFFFRNNTFASKVPSKWKEPFESEDADSKERLTALKNRIRQSGMEVFDGYPCHFAGMYDEKPIVAGLDLFGHRVLNNLWNAISKFYKKEEDSSELSEEEINHQMLIDSFSYYVGDQNSPLEWVMKELKKTSGIFVVAGKPGCGKTAFIARILKEVKHGAVISHFIGASSQSADLSYMLCHIGNAILSKFPLDISIPNTKESLLNNFTDIITEGSKAAFPGSLLIVIDGLDYLDVEAQTLDWLPYDLPQGFKLICSTSDSSEAFKSLLKREQNGCPPVYIVPIKPLVVTDRQQLVRHQLKQHGKALDESPFNNQMLQLVTKQDSGNPLYLQVACDYLKTFAVFENLMQKLQTFPPMLNKVLEEIIYQMEKSHGATIVYSALSMMCIAKEGLEEKEMHILLSVADPENLENSPSSFADLVEKIISLEPESLIPPVNFCSLVHMLKTFAYPFGNLSHGSLRLASKEFSSVVSKHYSKSGHMQKSLYFHRLLAAYYYTVCNPKGGEKWSGSSTTAFHGFLYHLLYGKCYTDLAEHLCCYNFLQGAFKVNAGEELPEYYETLLNGDVVKSIPAYKEKIPDYGDFVNQNMHVLKSWPFLIHQQALNAPVDSYVFKEHSMPKSWSLECVTRSPKSLTCHPKTLDGFAKNVICLKCHDIDPVAVLGSEDGSAKFLNIRTGKIISTLRGHSSSITSLCFLRNNRICLSSADRTLSIWSYSEHYRIAVLEGHTRFISSCCSDPQGNVVSAGWDCTVRFWSSQDGHEISCINGLRSPVNSVAHHPEQQLVACGLWNKTIEIWDALLLTKKSTLRGHSSSVRSVVFSANGIHMLSSSLNTEIFIWSVNECLKIAQLDGHTSFVNSIACSSRSSYIVTASDDTTLKVWPDEQQAVKMTIEEFKTHPVHFMKIVSQLHLAVAFLNSTLRVFDLVDGHVVTELNTISDPVSCFSKFNSGEDQKRKDCVDRSLEVLVFGTKSGKVVELKFEGTSVRDIGCLNSRITAMLHMESICCCGTTNGDLAVLSFDDKIPHGILYSAHENSVTALSISSTGVLGHILSASADKTVKFWDFGEMNGKENLTPKLIESYPSKHRDDVSSCCIYQSCSSSKAKPVMLTGSYDNTVVIWDEEKEVVLTGLMTSVSDVHFSGTYIVACGSEGSIAVWTQKGKCVSSIPGIKKSSAVIAFDFQKEKGGVKTFDATLAFVENDGSISIRKPFQRSSLYTLQGHGHSVTSCDINRSDVVLSCSLDKTVNIWNVPKFSSSNAKVYHSGKISSVAISTEGNLALSGDEYGNLMLWCINDEQGKDPMKYITQKKYTCGSIIAIRWMDKNKAVCAVETQSKTEENHFIEILMCKSSSELGSSFVLQVQDQKHFSSEIVSLDYHLKKDTVVVGLKSGHIFLMNSQVQKEIKVSDDWILKAKLSPAEDPILYIAEPEGTIKSFLLSALYKSKVEAEKTLSSDKAWITAIHCDQLTLYTGDNSGRITSYRSGVITTKQAHTAPVSDICIADNVCLLFSSSLDRTVKVWNLVTLKQIGQFHSQSPITCLAVPREVTEKSVRLMFGTIVCDVHLLKLRSPNQQPTSNLSDVFGSSKGVYSPGKFCAPAGIDPAKIFGSSRQVSSTTELRAPATIVNSTTALGALFDNNTAVL